MSKYKVGFFGGKFMPFHLGHLFCTRRMSQECEKGYLIIFVGGDQEIDILNSNGDEMLLPNNRWETVKGIAEMFPNIEPIYIDVTNVKLPDGSEDWDGETPLVREVCGNQIDAVYSSEYSYDDYFKRAYPEAKHVLVDPPRVKYPISATMIRESESKEFINKWLV